MRIYTQGLPDGSFRQDKYIFDVDISSKMIFIPNQSIGRDCLGEPLYWEQAKWLNQFEKEGCMYQGEGVWACRHNEIFEKILAHLQLIENFKGVYTQFIFNEKKKLKEIQEITIGKEVKIEKFLLKVSTYNDKEEIVQEKHTSYVVLKQEFFEKNTGKLKLIFSDEKEKTLTINLLNYSFEIQ